MQGFEAKPVSARLPARHAGDVRYMAPSSKRALTPYVKDDYSAANTRLGLGPIERNVKWLAGRAMHRGYAKDLTGDFGRMPLGSQRGRGHEPKATYRSGDDQSREPHRAKHLATAIVNHAE
jgi:hypothetical protein